MVAQTYGQLLAFGIDALKSASIEDARIEARHLFFHAAGFEAADLILKSEDIAPEDIISRFEAMIARRKNREPASLILGEVEFMGLTFRTDERALAPRVDSERLVECALSVSDGVSGGKIVDLGTGSGCLLLTFLQMRKDWSGVALDKSEDALSLARENAENLGLAARVNWIMGDWGAAEAALCEADLVISNPPYIPAAVVDTLSPEVRNHDPRLALDGGEDGLDAYRDILALLKRTLKPGARFIFEIGYDQGEALKTLFSEHGFAEFAVHKDFSGHNRVVEGINA